MLYAFTVSLKVRYMVPESMSRLKETRLGLFVSGMNSLGGMAAVSG